MARSRIYALLAAVDVNSLDLRALVARVEAHRETLGWDLPALVLVSSSEKTDEDRVTDDGLIVVYEGWDLKGHLRNDTFDRDIDAIIVCTEGVSVGENEDTSGPQEEHRLVIGVANRQPTIQAQRARGHDAVVMETGAHNGVIPALMRRRLILSHGYPASLAEEGDTNDPIEDEAGAEAVAALLQCRSDHEVLTLLRDNSALLGRGAVREADRLVRSAEERLGFAKFIRSQVLAVQSDGAGAAFRQRTQTAEEIVAAIFEPGTDVTPSKALEAIEWLLMRVEILGADDQERVGLLLARAQLVAQTDPRESIESMEEALTLNSDPSIRPHVLSRIGERYDRMNEHEKAAAAFEQACEDPALSPDEKAELCISIGAYLAGARRPEVARKYLSMATETKSRLTATTSATLGQALWEIGDLDAAIVAFREARRKAREAGDRELEANQLLGESVSWMRKAESNEDPSVEGELMERGIYLYERYQEIAEEQRGGPMVPADILAWIQMTTDDTHDVLRPFGRMNGLQSADLPDDPEECYRIARRRLAAGRTDDAVVALEGALGSVESSGEETRDSARLKKILEVLAPR